MKKAPRRGASQPPIHYIDPSAPPQVAVPPRQGLAIRRGLGWDSIIVELDPLLAGGSDRIIEVPINEQTGFLLMAFLARQAKRNGIPAEHPPDYLLRPAGAPTVKKFNPKGKRYLTLDDIT